MVSKSIAMRRLEKAAKTWSNAVLGEQLAEHTRVYFYDEGKLSHLMESQKKERIEGLYQQVSMILQSEYPLLKMREMLADAMTQFSELSVLLANDDNKFRRSFFKDSYLSGELYHHIKTIAEKTDVLDELNIDSNHSEDSEILEACSVRALENAYVLHGLNVVRLYFNDFDKEFDWFSICVEAEQIYQEDVIREKVGLSSLLPAAKECLGFQELIESVIDGQDNPYLERKNRLPSMAA